MRAMRKLLLLLLISFQLSGCGYSLVNREKSQLHGRSLAIAMFANRTYQPDLEAVLRRALVEELAAGYGAMLPEAGEPETLTIDTPAYSGADKAMIYRISISAEARLVERKSGRIIWKGRESVREEYPATADLGLQRNAREAAISAICRTLAGRIAMRLDNAF
jgi:outer membrane lipopolysaccharide assembly protein LptE/RlpB